MQNIWRSIDKRDKREWESCWVSINSWRGKVDWLRDWIGEDLTMKWGLGEKRKFEEERAEEWTTAGSSTISNFLKTENEPRLCLNFPLCLTTMLHCLILSSWVFFFCSRPKLFAGNYGFTLKKSWVRRCRCRHRCCVLKVAEGFGHFLLSDWVVLLICCS